jgi:hypothetical protein
MKVLPLECYDMILDYDWLESYNPMKVHWSAKWLSIPYGSRSVFLQGILSKVSQGTIVQVCQLSEEGLNLVSNEDSSINPIVAPEVQLLLIHVLGYLLQTWPILHPESIVTPFFWCRVLGL